MEQAWAVSSRHSPTAHRYSSPCRRLQTTGVPAVVKSSEHSAEVMHGTQQPDINTDAKTVSYFSLSALLRGCAERLSLR